MFCKNCGAQIEDDSKFCPACGNTVSGAISTGQAAAPQPEIKESKKGFFRQSWDRAIEDATADSFAARQARIRENKKNGVACCPKCGSISLSANKKGFGIGKAVVGAALTGGIGLAAGNIGAKKVRVTCLNCGNQFWAGKG